MKIKYKIQEVKPNIFAVIIKDDYDRAMTFLRVQEYYESPSLKFRGRPFSIWDYMKWYSKEYGRGFTYGTDWSGFNIPFNIATECFFKSKTETIYDEVMWEILKEINEYGDESRENRKAYIIGVGNITDDTFQHEVCHGLWHTDEIYRGTRQQTIDAINPQHKKIFKTNLLEMGYTNEVIDDEIQAYLQYGWESNKFGKGVPMEIREMYNSWFEDLHEDTETK